MHETSSKPTRGEVTQPKTDSRPVPVVIRTERLLLRPWRASDADALQPLLVANQEHIAPWIPKRVSDPSPVPILAKRLAGEAADFDADVAWRYGMFTPDERTVLGEIALFPRGANGRVHYSEADRVELGYWLRADWTGKGIVTEAARALLAVAAKLDRVTRVEIRCDERNVPSAAIPRRLGFLLDETIASTSITTPNAKVELQIWALESVDHLKATETRHEADPSPL
jgi:RimJ/RimL family protein N-acetyltransferase